MKERRQFSRIGFVTDVQVIFEDQKYSGELVDISLNGALLLPHEPMDIERGDTCELSFCLASPDVNLVFKALLIHEFNRRLGFKFISGDLETVTHLRRLLELNLGGDEAIARELSFLLHS